jgi:hypothetical protein
MENISTRTLGEHRQIGIGVKEKGSTLMMSLGRELANGEFTTTIATLAATSTKKFELFVRVNSGATPYETTKLEITLSLSPPGETKPVPIQYLEIPIQISNHYRHDPKSSILLVTNVCTTANEIDLWQNLVQRMGMTMDIWNVSLYGHMGLDQSLLYKYRGKTVILMGNQFPYFERGPRTVLNLIHKTDIAAATLAGTSFIVSNMSVNETVISDAPRYLRSGNYPHIRHFNTVKALVKSVSGASRDTGFLDTKFVVALQKGRAYMQKAQHCAKELKKHVPNLRFAIMPSPQGGSGHGEIEVLPCIPYDYGRFLISTNSTRRFDELNGFLIQYCLPFKSRIEMLWDLWANGPKESARCEGVAQIMEFDLVIEMARYIGSDPPWPDSIKKDDVLSHLKRISKFLGHNTVQQFSQSSIRTVTTILGNLKLLADSCLGSAPLALTFGTRRKNVSGVITYNIDVFLAGHYGHLAGDPARLAFQQYLREQAQQLSNENPSKRKDRLVQRARAQLPVGIAQCLGEGIDAVDLEMMGNIIGKSGEKETWIQTDRSLGTQLDTDLAQSKLEMVSHSSKMEYGNDLPAYS